MSEFNPHDPLGFHKKLVEDAFSHAAKLNEKYAVPMYLIFFNEHVFFEKERPLVGSCSKYYKVDDGVVSLIEVNLANGTENECELEQKILVEDARFKTMKKEEEHGEFRYSYLVKESGEKNYYSFDGGKHWAGNRKEAWNAATIRKNRMVVIPEKGVWPESSVEAINYFESSKAAKLTEEEGFAELNVRDLVRLDKLGSGFGFHGHLLRDPSVYPDPLHKKAIFSIDKAFIAATNKLKLPKWKVGAYADSKQARKDLDDLSGLVLDPEKTAEDFYLKDPEDVFQISYDFFLQRVKMFFDRIGQDTEEKLKNYWLSALEN